MVPPTFEENHRFSPQMNAREPLDPLGTAAKPQESWVVSLEDQTATLGFEPDGLEEGMKAIWDEKYGDRRTSLVCIGQELDHFSSEDSGSGNNPTWQQRTFVYDGFVPAGGAEVVFFYVGNEADVTLYVNHTGLMWENAQEFGALLVFAEHRYYGKSSIDVVTDNSNGINNNVSPVHFRFTQNF